jgi:DNA excision repair protein ERCC-2
VIVVGPALPPVGLERELLHAHFEQRYGRGFLYGSLVPGLTRVVQAAGRLVRRVEDRGVIVLVDRRFRWREVGALLPAEWDVEVTPHPARAIEEFFA